MGRSMPAWEEEEALMELARRAQAGQMPDWEQGSFQRPTRWSLPELDEVALNVPSRMPMELDEQRIQSRPPTQLPEQQISPRQPMQLPEETITARQPMQVDGLSFSPGQEPQQLAAQQPPAPPPDNLPPNPYDALDELAQPPMPTPEPPRTYQDVASRVEAPDLDGGQRPDLFGHEDENVHNANSLIARASQAHGGLPPDAPQAPTNRWEDEYLNSRKMPSDNDMWRSWVLNTLGGKEGDNYRMREMQMRERQQYDQGLNQARDRDMAASKMGGGSGKRISLGLAQAISAAGQMSPEEAVKLTENDPYVKAFVNGGWSAGPKTYGIDTSREKNKENNLTKLATTEANIDSREGIADNRNQTQLQVADKRAAAAAAKKPAGKGGGGQGLGADVLAAHLDEVANVGDINLMKRYLAGDVQPGEIPPAKLAVLEREKTIFAALPPKKQMEVLAAGSKRESGGVDAVGTYIDKSKADPKYAYKTQHDITDTAISLKNATRGWNAMSEQGKKAFVQLAPQGWAAIAKSSAIPEADKKHVGAVHGVMNELVKARAGSAVTESEWGRTAAELGLASGSWDPFNSSEGVTSYLNRARERLLKHKEEYNRVVGWQ